MIEIETGDLILVQGKSKVAKIIRMVMDDYAWQEGIKDKLTYSHAMTAVRIENNLYVAEAVENGFRLRSFYGHYDLDKDDLAVFKPQVPFTFEEKAIIRSYAIYLQEVNNFYEYWALLMFLPYVYGTWKWKGKRHRINLFGKGNYFSVYCYEGSYRIGKRVKPLWYPKNPEVVTCFDLQVPQMILAYINVP